MNYSTFLMNLAERESEIFKFETQQRENRKFSWNHENTKYSDNPCVLSDKQSHSIAIIWTRRVEPINRDFFCLLSEYD